MKSVAVGGGSGWARLGGRSRGSVRLGAIAKDRRPRLENATGNFFVDSTCIDCDTCRWMAPEVFTREGSQSAVTCQPKDPATRLKTIQAMLACPTFSIHARENMKGEIQTVQKTFPCSIENVADVFHCGFHDVKSGGAASYLIVRPEGNILVDAPRYHPRLAQSIQYMGGVKWMFLTHKHDVGDHAQWAAHLNAHRIIHAVEATKEQGTDECEVMLTGEGPWFLEDGSSDIEFIFTPGHSPGSVCMYHTPTKSLFTGDHLAYSGLLGHMTFHKRYGLDLDLQIDSTRKLLDYDFRHLFPGHGRRIHFIDEEHRRTMIEEGISHRI